MRKSRVTVAIVIAFVLAVFVLPFSGIASSLKQEFVSDVVQRGDNLSSIASRYGSSVGAIVQANGLASTVIGQDKGLRIPVGKAISGFRSPAASSEAARLPVELRCSQRRVAVVDSQPLRRVGQRVAVAQWP